MNHKYPQAPIDIRAIMLDGTLIDGALAQAC